MSDGRRDDEFDEVDAEVRGLAGAERFVRHGGDVRGRVSLEHGIAGGVENEHGAGRIFVGAGDDDGLGAVFVAAAEGVEVLRGRFASLQEDDDGAAATEAVGHVAVVVKEAGITLDGWTLFGEPPGLLRDFGFEAAAAHGSCAEAGGGEQHAGAGTTISRALDGDHGGQADFLTGCAGALREVENSAKLGHRLMSSAAGR